MSQPFRSGTHWSSTIWPGLSASFDDEQIILRSGQLLETLSSSVYGGGSGVWAHAFVNRKVPLSYRSGDPVEDLREMIRKARLPAEATVGLLTAAKLTHASVHEEAGDRFNIVCLATAGIGNAARAGAERQVFSAYSAGTINIFVLIDGQLSPSAMVGAIITATEAKCAALQDLGIPDPVHGVIATGTTTDSVVIAVSQNADFGAVHAYAGAATTLGNTLGRAVYRTVYESVKTRDEL
ncbi:adenosylcobinamide amidohydrolase [Paenibacillus phyllosphaerae]|uniref:Adenosylcobinamide amidohydrolase n=1 Tax=Paenibacillus phyllosphaerae TaxID=274593 RepID=A0A7W5AW02_9BACL|nr:adenosylcobinamide amidohydrolase [Paenibacillus phyllosphaerae]MBB3109494.1 adenosylcobinamide amidohydrolase [Paenibacillus phyllosphaerae]